MWRSVGRLNRPASAGVILVPAPILIRRLFMAQLSRRDHVYEQLGALRDVLRIAPGGQAESVTAGASSVGEATQDASEQASGYVSRVQSHLLAVTDSARPREAPSVPDSAALAYGHQSPYTACGPAQEVVLEAAPDVPEAGDELPGYRTRPPSPRNRFRHAIAGSSKKLEVVLESAGPKDYPVYIQATCPIVRGKVRLSLKGDDKAVQLRLRVKGVASTAVVRMHRSTYRNIVDEVEFWYESQLLWESTASVQLANDSVFEFPFAIRIPDLTPSTIRLPKTYAMPPSFAIPPVGGFEIGGISGATVRYYVKLTLARKGLLRSNDRLFAPFIYLPREGNAFLLPTSRREALINGTPLPSPVDAPDAWEGRLEPKLFKKGWFSKKTQYQVAFLLPKPQVYARSEEVPFYIRLGSEDVDALHRFHAATLVVHLVQRVRVYAQGTPGTQDRLVGTASVEVMPPVAADREFQRFTGVLSMRGAPCVSFQTHNINVSYAIACSLLADTKSGRIAETLANIAVKIVSLPPITQATDDASRLMPGDDQDVDLPPSYFEVAENS